MDADNRLEGFRELDAEELVAVDGGRRVGRSSRSSRGGSRRTEPKSSRRDRGSTTGSGGSAGRRKTKAGWGSRRSSDESSRGGLFGARKKGSRFGKSDAGEGKGGGLFGGGGRFGDKDAKRRVGLFGTRTQYPDRPSHPPARSRPDRWPGFFDRIVRGLEARGEMGRPYGPGNYCDDNLAVQLDVAGQPVERYLPLGTDATVLDNFRELMRTNPELVQTEIHESGTYGFYGIAPPNMPSHVGTVTVDNANERLGIIHSGWCGIPGRDDQVTSVVYRAGTDPRRFLRSYDSVYYFSLDNRR